MEDYKKLYRESLERGRIFRDHLLETGDKGIAGEIEYIFPELKVSEDEKIKKRVLLSLQKDFMATKNSGCSTKDLEDCITWLEKQGKEKSWKPSKEEMDVLYGLAYITNQYDEHKEEVITRLYQDLKREFFNGSSYENMFPTNTSTEDDVRRRSTIQVLEYARTLDTYNQYGKADIDKNITWLEKQGERKPTDKIEIGKKYKCIASPRYSTFMIGKIYKPEDKFLCNLMNFCYDCFEPIEDSEHNPILDFKAKDWYVSKVDGKIHNIYNSVDKVEPKFHEGEWIVQGYNILKIKCVGDTYYCFETVGGYVDDMLISEIDSQFHLWTIKDAKNGDVLINKNYMGESPFIFKETKPSNIKTDVPNPLTVLGYCGIGGAGFTKSSGWGDTANCIYYPATKSQRGTLLKAMADAGYTFDFEKKELKKIEQKPTWSSEDKSALEDIKEAITNYWYGDTQDILLDWLKRLKDRIGG